MEFKGVFIVALLAYCAQVTVAFPRSNFIVKEEEIEIVTDRTDEKLTTEQIIEHTGKLTILYLVLILGFAYDIVLLCITLSTYAY